MKSGIYLVTLNNEHPISVNAQDKRIADKVIKVTKENCKIGKAVDLARREKNYYRTFGEEYVNFNCLAILEEIAIVEKLIMARLDQYRIRGNSGKKNEWLTNISADEAKRTAIKAIEESGVSFEWCHEALKYISMNPR